MTNEEKANEISERRKDKHCVEYHCYRSAMEMAQWKDKQHEQEKQQWIDKLEDWLANNICNAYNFRGDDISATFMNDCIKAMKGK